MNKWGMCMAFHKFGAAFIALIVWTGPLAAQSLRPPATLPSDPLEADPAQQDESTVVLRIDRLESTLRMMNGQIEQLQFQNRQLQDAVRKLQDAQGQAPAAQAPPLAATDAGRPAALATTTPPAAPAKRSDAFDPASQPNAPGAPRALGIGPAPGLALPKDTGAPLDLGKPAVQTTVGGTIIADAGAENPRDEYELGVNFLKQGQYPDAENAFRAFIAKHPKDKLVPDALFGLGETFAQRSRPRDAAEQYLKISTDYATAPRAPEAMLRLGEALIALDAHEQACATFQEIGRKYPNASVTVKHGAERDIAKNKC